MHKPIDWQALTAPLDVMAVPVSTTHLRRWTDYTRTETGVRFESQLANGQPAIFQVDVIKPNILRVRMSPEKVKPGPAEILIPEVEQWPTPPFNLKRNAQGVTLEAGPVRVEFQRFPWHMRVFAGNQPTPLFSQRVDDRAYGPGYEAPPTGFEQQPDGSLTARETVAVAPGERFYGFGEKFTSLNKWGQKMTSWAVDSGNVSSQRSYKNVPFFMSSAGYGLFLHTTYPIVYRMGSQSSISYSLHVADNQLDYFLIYGPSFKQILSAYTELTGRAPMPPKWSFGFWISRCGYKSQAEVEEVARQMRARDFPADVISLDPWWMGDPPWTTFEWDRQSFPQPQQMTQTLRDQGLRTCLWIHPYVPAGSKAYNEGLANGYFVRRPASDNPAPIIESFSGNTLAAVDFTNPAARRWFEDKLDALLEIGVAVFKTDFGEQSPADAIYFDGRTGLEMHNLYPLLYNKTVFELTKRRFGRGLTWGRSGYAGSQRYPVQWGGDSYSSLDQMAGQLRGLLSYGLSGVPFCSHDVGGFDYSPQAFDFETQADYPKDALTYIRWLQFGVFSSHLRAHGKQPREPWSYGPQVEEIARRYLKLRYRLLPYIYSQAVKSTQTGLPLVKPLLLEYPHDANTHHLDWQYLFGDDLLVAPVLRADHRCRVYLPAGIWLDYWSKQPQSGGQWLDIDAPLDTIPVWVRAGAIIPMGPELAFADEKPLDPLTLALYQPQESHETIIYNEDKPQISARVTRRAGQLTVEVDPAPGSVELILYGVSAKSAQSAGKSLPLERHQGGQRVRFDGQSATTVEFILSD